ncbi:hypothetical protein B0H34DRAFT_657825, partial [Crassisporium funariophilum]
LSDFKVPDLTSPLPLFKSLTHPRLSHALTLPRIREILSMDGDSERLVPPSENIYGLTHPTFALNPHTFDKYAAYRFSLALQVVVNIGVWGSQREPRGQAGHTQCRSLHLGGVPR